MTQQRVRYAVASRENLVSQGGIIVLPGVSPFVLYDTSLNRLKEGLDGRYLIEDWRLLEILENNTDPTDR